MRLEPSHSCTQKQVIIVQSTARIMQTLKIIQTSIKNQTHVELGICKDTIGKKANHQKIYFENN